MKKKKINKKILAVIPARQGSKRLPGKNTRMLFGKPMISYSIDEALKSKYIDKIIVSTDDSEVKNIVKKYEDFSSDILTIVDRPKHLAEDNSLTESVVVHALQTISEDCDIVVLLQPTSPLRTSADIDNCIDIFLKEKCSSVLTVKEIQPFHIFVPNGAVFVTSKSMIIKHNKLWDENKRLMIMPQERSVDVDTETDFLLAEKLLSRDYENK